ncbi:MAG: hypothetical protein ACO31E_13265, partial [Phycisphaerales bacterium]
MKIKSDEITTVIRQEIEQYSGKLEISEVGQVVEVGDGIARVYGLSKAMAGELIEFQGANGKVMGQVMNLELDTVGCVLYGDATAIREGDTARATGNLLEVPVGPELLGRVVDPLGNALDGGPAINASGRQKVDIVAPGIAARQPVKEPLQFGIKAVDSMVPVGRGQRELVIGDRKTGKTAVCLDCIINQKQYWGTPDAVVCIYVAVGQKDSTVAGVVETLRKNGELDPYDGVKLEYIDPTRGGAAMPTISAFLQLLPKGFRTEAYRTTENIVFSPVEGTGKIIVGEPGAEKEIAFKPRDIFAVPCWVPFRL